MVTDFFREGNKDDIVERSPDGRYSRFNHKLGLGAFKTVFKGYDSEEGSEVAWNQVNMDRFGEVEKLQIQTEVNILRSLTHRHILTFFAYFDMPSTKQIVFITEMMTSGTLKQYIHKAKRVKRKIVKKWCRQILDGLAFLHEKRIIHRDLKCDNIFINGTNSEVKIGDLGLSTLMREGQGQVQSCLGTPEFMAPELYDELYDEKVDIYAFGMCVLEMVTSEYPYSECSNAAQIYRKVTQSTKPAALLQILDKDSRRFIDGCLEYEQTQRPSATQLMANTYLIGEPSKEDDEPVQLKPKPPKRPKEMFREPAKAVHEEVSKEPANNQAAVDSDAVAGADTHGKASDPNFRVGTPDVAAVALCSSDGCASRPAVVVATPTQAAALCTSALDSSRAVPLPVVSAGLGPLTSAIFPTKAVDSPALPEHAAPADVSQSATAPRGSCMRPRSSGSDGGSAVADRGRFSLDDEGSGSGHTSPEANRSSQVELTVHVTVAGEQKSVSFMMDFAADTPYTVALEMMEELEMPMSEDSLREIICQIDTFQLESVGTQSLSLPPPLNGSSIEVRRSGAIPELQGWVLQQVRRASGELETGWASAALAMTNRVAPERAAPERAVSERTAIEQAPADRVAEQAAAKRAAIMLVSDERSAAAGRTVADWPAVSRARAATGNVAAMHKPSLSGVPPSDTSMFLRKGQGLVPAIAVPDSTVLQRQRSFCDVPTTAIAAIEAPACPSSRGTLVSTPPLASVSTPVATAAFVLPSQRTDPTAACPAPVAPSNSMPIPTAQCRPAIALAVEHAGLPAPPPVFTSVTSPLPTCRTISGTQSPIAAVEPVALAASAFAASHASSCGPAVSLTAASPSTSLPEVAPLCALHPHAASPSAAPAAAARALAVPRPPFDPAAASFSAGQTVVRTSIPARLQGSATIRSPGAVHAEDGMLHEDDQDLIRTIEQQQQLELDQQRLQHQQEAEQQALRHEQERDDLAAKHHKKLLHMRTVVCGFRSTAGASAGAQG